MKDVFKPGVTLAIVCAIAAGGLALTYAATKDEIARQLREQQLKAYRDALPGIKNPEFKHREDLMKQVEDKYPLVTHVFDAYKNDKMMARGIETAPRGYGGFIDMVVGVGINGEVLGVSIINQNETPGLGATISQKEFLVQFKGKDTSSPMEISRDVDAISGATRSSKAVTSGVKEALEAFKATERE